MSAYRDNQRPVEVFHKPRSMFKTWQYKLAISFYGKYNQRFKRCDNCSKAISIAGCADDLSKWDAWMNHRVKCLNKSPVIFFNGVPY
jgi:hypothetical protein